MSTEKKVDTDTAWVFKQFLFEEVLCDLDNHFQRLNVDYMPIKGALFNMRWFGTANQVAHHG